jgi:hypothetical protein
MRSHILTLEKISSLSQLLLSNVFLLSSPVYLPARGWHLTATLHLSGGTWLFGQELTQIASLRHVDSNTWRVFRKRSMLVVGQVSCGEVIGWKSTAHLAIHDSHSWEIVNSKAPSELHDTFKRSSLMSTDTSECVWGHDTLTLWNNCKVLRTQSLGGKRGEMTSRTTYQAAHSLIVPCKIDSLRQ